MSVVRCGHPEEMPRASRATGEELARRIRAVWARARRLVRGDPGYRHGVHRFASLEEAQADRLRAARARAVRLRAGSSADSGSGA